MPKLVDHNNYICHLCGSQAFFVSFNLKKYRCVEKITQCPGFVKKAEESRQKNMTLKERQDHMKKMSQKGNETLKMLHNNYEWVSNKGKKISESVKKRGGHSGKNNPMYGKFHNQETKKKLSEKANKRDLRCYDKATETKISKGIAIAKDLKSEWEVYKEQVNNYTYKSWKYHQDKINPFKLKRGKEYELDHKFSITEGFKQNIKPEIIGHYSNLELIPKFKNRSKRINCSITVEDLIKGYTR